MSSVRRKLSSIPKPGNPNIEIDEEEHQSVRLKPNTRKCRMKCEVDKLRKHNTIQNSTFLKAKEIKMCVENVSVCVYR